MHTLSKQAENKRLKNTIDIPVGWNEHKIFFFHLGLSSSFFPSMGKRV
jgi:hypothetical protein